MSTQSKKNRGNIFLRMHPLQRIAISIILSVATFFMIEKSTPLLIRLLSLWIAFAFSYLFISWIILFTRPIAEISKAASKDDGSITVLFLMILLSSCAGMFAVLMLIISNDAQTSGNNFFLPSVIGGMILSWAMVHTLFTFHYAHRYYNDDNGKPKGGLEFPSQNFKPDYIDFAYFSFVIGCTFQVSDIEISSRQIRRFAFLHQLISFVLNTFVVALTINLIAGLSK